MDAVIIGVSDRSLLWRDGSLTAAQYPAFVDMYGKFLSSVFDNVIITPHDGVYTDVADSFSQHKHKKAVAYYPDQDTTYGYESLKPKFQKYEIKEIGGDWYTLNAELTKQAPVVICLGYSPGALIELSFIKFHQQQGQEIHTYIDQRCSGATLPLGFREQIKQVHEYATLGGLAALLPQNHQELASLIQR